MNNLKNIISRIYKKIKKRVNQNPQEMRFQSPVFWSSTLTWGIIGTFGLGILYASISKIDEIVITRGELQAIGSQRPIKMPFSGMINKITIKEGDEVIAGQVLIKLDKDINLAKKDKLTYELKSNEKIIQNEENILSSTEKLALEGAISTFELIRQRNKVEELVARQNTVKTELREIKYLLDKSDLKSPVDGKVFNLIPSSSGYAASSGETLLEIVPSGVLEAKVFFKNSDVGFLRSNMKAEIRVDAYPFTQFGFIEGNLKSVGEESLPVDQFNREVRFPAYVSLSKQYLSKKDKMYFVKSGQTVTVNFLVREKPLITLLTDVIANSWDSLRGIKTEGGR